jgi:histidinol-phosphate/aromatic aminotransferase/cobyric acid decarboxylase-like protein
MAGLRIGYGAASAELVHEAEKARGPYKENAPGERAAAMALREDVQWMRDHVTLAVEHRERFVDALRPLGLAPLPSSANFVLIPVPDEARAVCRAQECGVIVRAFVGLPGIGDALRITIGPWPVMERALDALAYALAPDAGLGGALRDPGHS